MIREARVEDIDAIMDLVRSMHAESAYASIPFSETRALNTVIEWLSDSHQIAFVAEDDGELYGIMAGWMIDHWFGEGCFAHDAMIYVKPERRGGIAGARLVQNFLRWAKEKGARRAAIAVTASINDEAVSRLLRGLGMTRFGETFVKEC